MITVLIRGYETHRRKTQREDVQVRTEAEAGTVSRQTEEGHGYPSKLEEARKDPIRSLRKNHDTINTLVLDF